MAKINKKEQQIINQGGYLEDIKNRLDRKPTPGIPPVVPVRPDLELRDEPDDPTGQVCTIPYHCGQGYLCCYSGFLDNGSWYGIHEGCNTFDDLNTCYPCPTEPALNELSDYEYEHCTGLDPNYEEPPPEPPTWFEENAWVEGIHDDPYVGFDNDDYFIHDFSGVGYNYGGEIPNPGCDYEIPIAEVEFAFDTLVPYPCNLVPECNYEEENLQSGTYSNSNISVINNAIEQVHNEGGGTVCLPEGTFIITSTDEYEMITLKSNVVLKGRVVNNGDPTTYLYFYGGILSDDDYYSYLDDSGLLDMSEVSKVPYIGTIGGEDDVSYEIDYEPDITVGTNILTISDNHDIQIGDLLSITIKDDSEGFIQGYNYFYDEAFTEEVNEFITGTATSWDGGVPHQKYYRKVIGITEQNIILDLPHRIAVCEGECGYNKTTIKIVDVHSKNNNIGIMNLFVSDAVDTYHFNKFALKGETVVQIAHGPRTAIIKLQYTINSFIKNVHTVTPTDMGLPINTSPAIEQTCQFYDVRKPIPDTVPPLYYIDEYEEEDEDGNTITVEVEDYFTGAVTNYVDAAAKILGYYDEYSSDEYGVDKHTDCYNLEDDGDRVACCNVIFDVLDNDVRFFNDKQNVDIDPESKRLLNHGIAINSSSNITIENTTMALPQIRGGGSQGYMFKLNDSTDILLKGCHGYRGRHNFSSVGRCSGIVYSEITTKQGWGNNVYGDANQMGPTANINNSTTDWWSRYMQSEFLLMHGNPSVSDTHGKIDLVQLVTDSQLHDGWKTYNRGSNSSGAGITSDEFYFWNISGVSRDEFTWQEYNNPSLLMNHQARKGYIYGTTNMHVSEVLNPEGGYPYPYDDFMGTHYAKPMIDFTPNPGDYTNLQSGDWFEVAVGFFLNELAMPLIDKIFTDANFETDLIETMLPECSRSNGDSACKSSGDEGDSCAGGWFGVDWYSAVNHAVNATCMCPSDKLYCDGVQGDDDFGNELIQGPLIVGVDEEDERIILHDLTIGNNLSIGLIDLPDYVVTPYPGMGVWFNPYLSSNELYLGLGFTLDEFIVKVRGYSDFGCLFGVGDIFGTIDMTNIQWNGVFTVNLGRANETVCDEVPIDYCGDEDLGYDYCENVNGTDCRHKVNFITTSDSLEYDLDLSGDWGCELPDLAVFLLDSWLGEWFVDWVLTGMINETVEDIIGTEISNFSGLLRGFVYNNETNYAYFTEPALTDKIQQPNPDTSFNDSDIPFLYEEYRNLFEYQQYRNESYLEQLRIDTDNDGVPDAYEVDGCTDSNACNYNAYATEDDGSCEYFILGDINRNCLINIQDILMIVSHIVSYQYCTGGGSCEDLTVSECNAPTTDSCYVEYPDNSDGGLERDVELGDTYPFCTGGYFSCFGIEVSECPSVCEIFNSEGYLDEFQQSLADVNQDGEINVADIITIVQQILGEYPEQQSAIMNEVKKLLQTVTK